MINQEIKGENVLTDPHALQTSITDKIPVTLSKSRFKSKPTNFGSLNYDLNNSSVSYLTYKEFCNAIGDGHAYLPAMFNGKRSNQNFRGQRLFCLDFDDLGEIDKVLSDPDRSKGRGANAQIILKAHDMGLNPVCLYATYSYTLENPKCRLVLDYCEVLTDKNKRDRLATHLLMMFKEFKPDEATKDCARLWLGTSCRERVWEQWHLITKN